MFLEFRGASHMTSEQIFRMKELCLQVQTESDRMRYAELVLELAILLELRGNDLAKGTI